MSDDDLSPRILVFYSRECPGCLRKLGLAKDGVTQITQTNLTKALELMSYEFEVIRFDIMEESNKAQLLSITMRPDSYIPVIVTPFALLENPPLASIVDLVEAMLGLKILLAETGGGHHRVQ